MPNTEASKMAGKIAKDIMLNRLNWLGMVEVNHNSEKTRHEWGNIERLVEYHNSTINFLKDENIKLY
jgi:hypothetical protein